MVSTEATSALGYSVREIHIGIVCDVIDAQSKSVAQKLRHMLPDRIRTHYVNSEGLDDDFDAEYIGMLVICCSQGLKPETVQFIKTNILRSDTLVWTDLDLDRNLEDRHDFYAKLELGGLGKFVPRRVYLTPPEVDVFGRKLIPNQEKTQKPTTIVERPISVVDRQDQLEINGKILLKPVLQRSVDPNDSSVTIYYPRSQGGGAKILQFSGEEDEASPKFTAQFDPKARHVPRAVVQPILYEELLLSHDSSDKDIVIRKRERKRDRIKNFMKKLSGNEQEGGESSHFGDDDQISYESDLSRMDRKIFVVTTASLPWMTGTAVNPLLRAAYLKRGRPTKSVTLVIPWLEREKDRMAVYGKKRDFQSSQQQELYVRDWLRNQAGMPEEADPENGVQIMWYPSRYYTALGSIFPSGDICKQIPAEDADICILEEPEHLNWIRGEEGEIWTEKFNHVVGVIHTNYRAYASASAAIAAPVISGLSSLMVRAYCTKVIKLSATLQAYSPEKEVVCNIHGVRSDFLDEGKRRGVGIEAIATSGQGDGNPVAYFIGKLLWEKGLDRLLRLQYFYKEVTGDFFPIDIVGDGPNRNEIQVTYNGQDVQSIRKVLASNDDTARGGFSWETVTEQLGSVLEIPSSLALDTGKIPGQFYGRQDHAQFCKDYKVIVNPSITEVLCTTTAEALAMGKFAVIPKHPSNDFFLQFPNCLAYENKVDFVSKLIYALSNEPVPLAEELSYIFTWEAATERLIQNSAINMKEARNRAKVRKGRQDDRIAKMYNKLGIRGHNTWLLGAAPDSPTKAPSPIKTKVEGDDRGSI